MKELVAEIIAERIIRLHKEIDLINHQSCYEEDYQESKKELIKLLMKADES